MLSLSSSIKLILSPPLGGPATPNLLRESWRDQTPGVEGGIGGLMYVSGWWPFHPPPPSIPALYSPSLAPSRHTPHSVPHLFFLSSVLVCDVGKLRSPWHTHTHPHTPWCIRMVISPPSCLCYALIYHNSSFYHTHFPSLFTWALSYCWVAAGCTAQRMDVKVYSVSEWEFIPLNSLLTALNSFTTGCFVREIWIIKV